MTIKYFTFLKGVIDYSSLYKLIKPQIPWIINSVLPVALAITKEEQVLWKEDPIQFVNQVYDVSLCESV